MAKEGCTVHLLGDDFYGQCGPHPGLPAELPTTVVQVACGDYHTVLLLGDGTVWTCGYNRYGQLGDGTTQPRSSLAAVSDLQDVVHVAAGAQHTVAVRADGSVYVWGAHTAFSPAGIERQALLRPRHIKALANEKMVAVAAGYGHTVVLSAIGNAYAFGLNTHGQCGQTPQKGTVVERPLLVKKLLKSVQVVACGRNHTCLVDQQGRLYTMGAASGGRLGVGTVGRPYVSSPTLVNVLQEGREGTSAGSSRVTAVAGGWAHTVLMTSAGQVYAMGSSSHGQVGVGPEGALSKPHPVTLPPSHRAVGVAAANYATALLTEDGRAWMLGCGSVRHGGPVDNGSAVAGLMTLPGGEHLARVRLLACGGAHVVAVT